MPMQKDLSVMPHEGIHHINHRCKIMAAEMETRLRDSVQNLSKCEAWQHLACHSCVANLVMV